MKKILIIIFSLFFISTANANYENEEFMQEATKIEVQDPNEVEYVPIKPTNSNYTVIKNRILQGIGFVVVMSFFIATFVLGLFVGVGVLIVGGVIMIPVAIYYESRELIIKDVEDEIVEVKLCPAALDITANLDINKKNKNAIIIKTPKFIPNNIKKVEQIEPFFKSPNRINEYNTHLCTNCYLENYSSAIPAKGIWHPIRAYYYKTKSYIQLAQYSENSKEYFTTTTEFKNIVNYLQMNNITLFPSKTDSRMNIRHLCTRLKQLSVHKLKNMQG
tara:strand:+ start:1290 stop:2114 length:825 start_codon:yes stop_codon:yes gene_type:complete